MLACASSSSLQIDRNFSQGYETSTILLQLCLRPAFTATSVSNSRCLFAYACPDDAAQQYATCIIKMLLGSAAHFLSSPCFLLATPDTKWCTIAITTVLGKICSAAGSPPEPLKSVLNPTPLNMQHNEILLTHAFQEFHKPPGKNSPTV